LSSRLGVQFPQAGQHRRVCRVADPIRGQQLEGPTWSPFGQEGPDGRRCPVRSRGRDVRGLGCRRPGLGPRARAVCRCGPFNSGDQFLKGVEDRRQAVEAALLRGGRPCGLPSAGRGGQRDAGEEEKAGQGLPRLLALQGLQQARQGPGAAGGGRNGC